jgi:HTH-type transcriptional regulator/antitoxin HigA
VGLLAAPSYSASFVNMLTIIEGLMAMGEGTLTAEESALLDLLVDLVHDFEERYDPLPSSPPHRMVAFLLNSVLTPSALYPVLGTKSWASEVPSGERGITKAQAKKLAAFFHVGVAFHLTPIAFPR